MEDKLMGALRNWSSVDVLLHRDFNETLWKNIANYGEDFWNKLKFYQNHRQRIVEFCSDISSTRYIIIPESAWGSEFRVDYVWCLVNRLSPLIIRNIIRVKQYPELCDQITSSTREYEKFYKSRTRQEVTLNPDFCSTNQTSSRRAFQIPLPILINGIYDF